MLQGVNPSLHSRIMSEKSEQQPQPDQAPSPIGEISQEPSSFEAFLDANQKKLIIFGIFIIIALVAYVVIDGLKQQELENYSAEVSAARTLPELEAQASEKAGTNAGGTALLRKAQLQWRDLQQSEAIETLESFVSDYPDHPAYASGLASLASYQYKMGNLEGAKENYEKAVEEKAAISSMALIYLGDIARGEGNDEAAGEYYDRASSEYGDIHLNIRQIAERHSKLLGVSTPTEVKPAPPAPKPGAASEPVKVDPLPTDPDLPKNPVVPEAPNSVVPEAPKPVTPAAPKPALPEDPKPVDPKPPVPEDSKPETPAASTDSPSN